MKVLNEKDFDDAINNPNMTIVDFSANWCMHCRTLMPVLTRLEGEMPEYNFCKVDIDECENIAKRYRVFSIPMMACFKEGKLIDTMIGLAPTDEIVEFFKNCDTKSTN